jgi:propanediol dehydratase large subunit
MTTPGPPTPNRWRRFDEWDARPLRLDKFTEEAPEQGFCAIA